MPLVVVAGSSGGIGRETASLLREKGFRVAGIDSVAGETPGSESEVLDITDRQGVLDYIGKLKEPVDALVVCAAVHSTHPVEFLPDELIDSVLDVNLNSHIKLVRDFLPVVKNGGSVIGVSSIAACIGVPMSSLYSASKAGLERFYESMRTELGYRNIRVSVIHPGNVNTGFNETGNTYEPQGLPAVDKHYRDVVDSIDSRYGIDPEKVARVIVRVMGKSNPRFCYVVGVNARKANWAKKLLGRDLAIRLMGRFFGF